MKQKRKLGEICEIKRGKSITKKLVSSGNIPVIAGGREPAYFHNEANRIGPIITVSGSGAGLSHEDLI
jgi:type I restriction enzyme S subunit